MDICIINFHEADHLISISFISLRKSFVTLILNEAYKRFPVSVELEQMDIPNANSTILQVEIILK